MKVLITGGAGFIGSNLVRKLLEEGCDVRILDNFSTGVRANLQELEGAIDLLEGDIRDPRTCATACRGIEAVLHQAAIGSVPRSIDDPLTTHDVNVTGTLNVLLAARDAGVHRITFASSSSVYGDAAEREKIESLPPRPMSPYAVSKLAAESYTLVFGRVYGLETVALRYFNVFGPRQDPESMYAAVVPKFVSSLLQGRAPTVYGDGNQVRDFTYVDNVVDANLESLRCQSGSCGRVYNIACGGATSVNELYLSIRGFVAESGGPLGGLSAGELRALDPVYAPPRPGDVRDSLASVEAARGALGYVAGISVDEGLRRTVQWYREHRS